MTEATRTWPHRIEADRVVGVALCRFDHSGPLGLGLVHRLADASADSGERQPANSTNDVSSCAPATRHREGAHLLPDADHDGLTFGHVLMQQQLPCVIDVGQDTQISPAVDERHPAHQFDQRLEQFQNFLSPKGALRPRAMKTPQNIVGGSRARIRTVCAAFQLRSSS